MCPSITPYLSIWKMVVYSFLRRPSNNSGVCIRLFSLHICHFTSRGVFMSSILSLEKKWLDIVFVGELMVSVVVFILTIPTNSTTLLQPL